MLIHCSAECHKRSVNASNRGSNPWKRIIRGKLQVSWDLSAFKIHRNLYQIRDSNNLHRANRSPSCLPYRLPTFLKLGSIHREGKIKRVETFQHLSIFIPQGKGAFRTEALIIVTAKIYLVNWSRHRCVNHRVYTNNIHGSRETCFHERCTVDASVQIETAFARGLLILFLLTEE